MYESDFGRNNNDFMKRNARSNFYTRVKLNTSLGGQEELQDADTEI
jgi:hypothetical protein